MLGPQLASIHNLTHYQRLMHNIRCAIEEGRFKELYRSIKEQWRGQTETVL